MAVHSMRTFWNSTNSTCSLQKTSAHAGLLPANYLLTLNTALVALYGFQSAGFGENYWTLLVPITGIIVSLLWRLIIKSHADLNRVKFKVIHELEQHLPAAMFKYEWRLAEEGQGKVYRAVTTIELMDTCSVRCAARRSGDHNHS